MNKRGRQVVSAGALLVLAGLAAGPVVASVDLAPAPHAATAENETAADPFPLPEALRDNVAFWRKVFAEWRQNQVALHDMDYPGLIYQIIELQGEADDNLTDAQRDQIKSARAEWEARLKRVATAEPIELSADELALRQRIVEIAGIGALADAYLRLRTQRGVRERFLRGLAHSGRYDATFRRIFQEAGLPEDLAYLPHVESSFQNHARSSVGATGMWQFTRSAGRVFMAVNKVVDERLDPVASARGAARYLAEAHERLGSWPLAITSYNHGMQGVARAKAQFGDDFGRIVREYQSKSFGFASRNFYAEFLAAREIASQPERYFPEGIEFDRPLNMDRVVLERSIHAHELAARYGLAARELAAINPAWSSRVVSRKPVPLPAGVEVWLPAGTLVAVSARNKAILVAATRKQSAQARGGIMNASLSGADVHVVRHGDTLLRIAQRYKVDMVDLRALNNMAPQENRVRVGQKVKLRGEAQETAPDVVIHVVRKGDTASVIAANYGVSVADLLATNQLTKHSVIHPGQRLDIPVSR